MARYGARPAAVSQRDTWNSEAGPAHDPPGKSLTKAPALTHRSTGPYSRLVRSSQAMRRCGSPGSVEGRGERRGRPLALRTARDTSDTVVVRARLSHARVHGVQHAVAYRRAG